MYRAQLEVALADGKLSEREASVLTKARGRLGITEEDHARLQREVLAAA